MSNYSLRLCVNTVMLLKGVFSVFQVAIEDVSAAAQPPVVSLSASAAQVHCEFVSENSKQTNPSRYHTYPLKTICWMLLVV